MGEACSSVNINPKFMTLVIFLLFASVSKMKKQIFCLCCLIIYLSTGLIADNTHVYAEGRSPFQSSPNAGKPYQYNYTLALETLILKGTINTEEAGVAVFQTISAPDKTSEYLIIKKNEKFVITLNKLGHTFRLHAFKDKKVILIAGNKEVFEVAP
jgi:hypothetical protein